MALNYSHRPLFPAHISEDNLVSPMRKVNGYFVEGNPDNFWEAYGRSCHGHGRQGEAESWSCNSVWDRLDGCGSPESSTSKDVVDLLPPDPFEMDIKTTVTAITGWLQDLHGDYGEYIRSSKKGASQDNCGLFFPWSLMWNNDLNVQPKVDNCKKLSPSHHASEEFESHCFMNVSSKVTHGVEKDIEGALPRRDFNLTRVCDVSGDVGVGSRNGSCSHSAVMQVQSEEVDCAVNSESVLHEALRVALRYLGLGVKDLLSIEKVCKPLCSTVRSDRLLWCSIHIDQPLNEKITDDVLVQLASRAQGDLQCLSLVECLKVTVDGLRRVLETNPRLTKLCVPGCTRLSVDGILDIIRTHNSRKGVPGIKLVRIGGLNVVNPENFENLKFLLAGSNKNIQSSHRPHFYRWGSVYLSCDDDRAIDVEKCPRCEKIRMVYDCPAEGCQVKDGATPPCRACKICIPRCDQCGTCIDERVFEETFCLDVLCADCFRQVRYQGHEDEQAGPQVSVEE